MRVKPFCIQFLYKKLRLVAQKALRKENPARLAGFSWCIFFVYNRVFIFYIYYSFLC